MPGSAAGSSSAAERLFAGVMAPLVLGGSIHPGHAIGARVALQLGAGDRTPADTSLYERVQMARVRRARRLAPVDSVGGPTAVEWALAAALNDVFQAMSPEFDRLLRRRAAQRILEVAGATLERVNAPESVREALGRHTWFARVLDTVRTDTALSWWLGSHTYRGVEPPPRLLAWPEVRRVRVVTTPRALLELSPTAVDSARLLKTISRLLERTPLTDLATCTRAAPVFAWSSATLGLVATRAGKALALRALARLPPADVDVALGRATRDLLRIQSAEGAEPAALLLAARALAEVQGHLTVSKTPSKGTDSAFAQTLGANRALRLLEQGEGPWTDGERASMTRALTRIIHDLVERGAFPRRESD